MGDIPEEVVERIRASILTLIDHYEREVCTHEDTHRGGNIWTICDACGRKWADDEGGFIPYVEPEFLAEARAIVALLPEPVDPDVLVAREIALKHALPGSLSRMSSFATNRGDADGREYMRALVAAIKRGRHLAEQSK